MGRQGRCFQKLKYFPFLYIKSALQALLKTNDSIPNAPAMTPSELVEAIAHRGVDYNTFFSDDMQRLELGNALLANFDPNDFAFALLGDTVVNKHTSQIEADAPSVSDLAKADQMVLQGISIPHGTDGKRAAMHYSYARALEPL